ncbi:helix-turn-helix domain-containing protein [Mesorhizobium xinjiangense]|uniref:helix-turn-helix domain-containing protein n=1 Tax=Mesorhizobium xinjiangense TaxID=2678685 RepID=UPI001F3F42E0|nr:helix-turn-helix domain-containing protein [Mesorhizobium xinjiangense]
MDGKITGKRYWEPAKSTVEKAPTRLVSSHGQPGIMRTTHWHAQVEVNYVFRGRVDYRMQDHDVNLKTGDLCLFWGGLPHRVVDTSEDAWYIAIHVPLVHFFRLRLTAEMQQKLMRGATLIAGGAGDSDDFDFNRWSCYIGSREEKRIDHAIDELLLRIERIQFEPHRLLEGCGLAVAETEAPDRTSFHSIGRICAFIAENFRHDIDSTDIALSADIHPKYAMSVFKKSTGMTLNEYVSLLRLSYAQALLMQEDANVLRVAMDSGFGSLSAFTNCFRKIAGMSPSDFRQRLRNRPQMPPAGLEERPLS